MKYLFVFFYLILSQLHAQELEQEHHLAIRMNRLDLFIQYGKAYVHHKHTQEVGFGFGLNRTVFQQRMFPEIYYRYTFSVLKTEEWNLGLGAGFYASAYELNKKTHAWSSYQELVLGLAVSYGRRFKVRVQLDWGLMLENQEHGPVSAKSHHLGRAYNRQIGFAYVF